MIDILTLAAAKGYTDKAVEQIKDISPLTFKGIKETVSELPLTGNVGDVYHVRENGQEYVWFDSNWEEFGKELPTNIVVSDNINTIWTGTQEAYDEIINKDPNTIYFIVAGE